MRTHRGSTLAFALAGIAGLLLSACGSGALNQSGLGTGSASSGFVPGSRVHTMPMSDPNALTNQASNTHLLYYGGHVISNVKVIAVYWGSGVNSTVQSDMPAFYTDFTKSPMFDWLNEYDTNITAQNGSQGTNQTIGHGTFDKAVTITPSVTSSTVSDSQIQSELNSQISAGNLPAPDANTIYMIDFPKGITISQGGSYSCQAFCAYHGTFTRSGQSVYYGVLPSIEAGTGCDTGCGGASSMIDNQTSVASHELIEAVTDAEVGLATSYGPPLAWYDPDPSTGEIGDICNASQGSFSGASGRTWTVQKEWSNSQQACVTQVAGATGGGGGGGTGGGTGGTGNFSLTVSTTSVSLAAGSSATLTVHTAVTSGSAETVSFKVTGLPTGVTGSFSSASVTAGGDTVLTLTAGSSAAAVSSDSFRVYGTSASYTHYRTAYVTVTAGSGGGGGGGGGTGNFSMTISSTSVTVAQGGTTTITVHTAVTTGSAATVNFKATGLPSGVSASFSPASVTAGGSSTLTLTATSSAAAVSADSFRVYGRSTNYTHYRTSHVTVTTGSGGGGGGGGTGGTGDFSMTLSTTSLTLSPGGSKSLTVSTALASGSGATITFHVPTLPTGVTASFSSATIDAGQSTTLTLHASASAPAISGKSFRVYGKSGTHTHYRGAHVTVQ